MLVEYLAEALARGRSAIGSHSGTMLFSVFGRGELLRLSCGDEGFKISSTRTTEFSSCSDLTSVGFSSA